ncbi:hypothetical protein [Caproiciproducens faecalis]|uniref:Uncharacterized protein n=1 Tax=Caproiciproducens faecalis TaxID=2820301 RepID=A0ABS7DMF2_9FIRM|nr:hypothetical protein [Caproiciproducens faecalis]MBW7572482.1 hypothetical protein [Caproiciproducens faecalis]
MDRQELVDTLRNLSQQAEQNDLKKVLMPQILPTDMADSKRIDELMLTGELPETFTSYDIPFLLHFIADMIEE